MTAIDVWGLLERLLGVRSADPDVHRFCEPCDSWSTEKRCWLCGSTELRLGFGPNIANPGQGGSREFYPV